MWGFLGGSVVKNLKAGDTREFESTCPRATMSRYHYTSVL